MTLLAVNHHYYRSAGNGRGIYPTTPAMLRDRVGHIRAAGWRLGTQADLLALADGGTPRERVCVLTFDDGLKEQMAAIADLSTLGAAALCFVPTGPLIEGYVLEVHKLHMVRAQIDDETLAERLHRRFGFRDQTFDEEVLAVQYRYDEPLSRRVKYFLNFTLDAAQRDEWLRRTFDELFGDEHVAAAKLYMSRDDLQWLAARGLLGSHAHDHRPLATLAPDAMRSELGGSHERLRALTGTAPLGISYPYGGQSAVSETVFAAARDCGYRYGFTMKRGVNGGGAQPLALDRIDTNDLAAWVDTPAGGRDDTPPASTTLISHREP